MQVQLISFAILPIALLIALAAPGQSGRIPVLSWVAYEISSDSSREIAGQLAEQSQIARYVVSVKRAAPSSAFMDEAGMVEPLLIEGNSYRLKELVEKVRRQITRLQELRKDKAAVASSGPAESRFRNQRVKLCYFSPIQCLFAFKSAPKAKSADISIDNV